MKILKKTLIISSYVLLVALFFGGGYAIGRIGTDTVPDTAVTPPEATAAAEQAMSGSVEETAPYYEVIAESNMLKIYRCEGKVKDTVASEQISIDIYPRSDVAELREGVSFDSLAEAQRMFENFVS